MKAFLTVSMMALMFAGSQIFAGDVKIIAHRGASYKAPENTVSAVKLGYEEKADACEIDIYMTTDNQIMLLHDGSTSRTTGVNLEIMKSSSKQLENLDAGKWKSREYAGEKLPYLKDVFTVVPEGKKLVIEIKHDAKILPFLMKEIDESKRIKDIIIICFNYDTLKQAKAMKPEIPMYWLVYAKKDEKTKQQLPYDESIIAKAKEANFDALNLGYGGLTKEFIEKGKKAGLGMYVWTVDDPKISKNMAEIGIDGITTNKPAFTREIISSK